MKRMPGLKPLSSKMQWQNISEKKYYSFNLYIYKQSNFYTAELRKFCYILSGLPLTCHFQYSLYTEPIMASNFTKYISRYTATPPNNPTGKLQDILSNLQHWWYSVSWKFAVSLLGISWCSDTTEVRVARVWRPLLQGHWEPYTEIRQI